MQWDLTITSNLVKQSITSIVEFLESTLLRTETRQRTISILAKDQRTLRVGKIEIPHACFCTDEELKTLKTFGLDCRRTMRRVSLSHFKPTLSQCFWRRPFLVDFWFWKTRILRDLDRLTRAFQNESHWWSQLSLFLETMAPTRCRSTPSSHILHVPQSWD